MTGTRLYSRVAQREYPPSSVQHPKVIVILEAPENDPMRFLLEGISASGDWWPDTIHKTVEDAQAQAQHFLGDAVGEWREVPLDLPDDGDAILRWALERELAIDTLCSVCGYDLGFEAWRGESSSDEMCPSCGIQFGYQDAGRTVEDREPIYAEWRLRWVQEGAPWRSVGPSHKGWDPREQLKRLGRQLPDDSVWYQRHQRES